MKGRSAERGTPERFVRSVREVGPSNVKGESGTTDLIGDIDALRMSHAVLDGYAARILIGTSGHGSSAGELSERYGIPIAACYRRIRRLESLGLVYCEAERTTSAGKRIQIFRSAVRSARIALEGGHLLAQLDITREAPSGGVPPEG